MNMEDKDWVETEIWIASEDDFRNHYSDEITKTEDRDSEESSIVQSMKTIYPFEVTDSLNRHYKVGHVNKKQKDRQPECQCKKGLEEGYYPILIYISKARSGRGRNVLRVRKDHNGVDRDKEDNGNQRDR